MFQVGHKDLGIVSVLDHMGVRRVQAEVIGEYGEQQRTKDRALENSHGVRKRFRNHSAAGGSTNGD